MKKIIATDKAPKAIGPYSQAVQTGNLVFCSGQIALDPATQEFQNGSIEEQTRRVLENLQAVLAAAGSDLNKVMKTTIYLADMADFAAVNAVYAEYFPTEPPARATVAVRELPKGAKVEIDAVAEI
jgi:2-iminobutanoate/2-iminopropanoate deaminase